MKITIDTEKKTIKLHTNILISDFIKELSNYIPPKEWINYTLQVEPSEVQYTSGSTYIPFGNSYGLPLTGLAH